MNILHHKSWHVYSQKNKDKVQEDEAKAAEEVKKQELEKINQERSDRLAELRRRAGTRYQDTPSLDYLPKNTIQHIPEEHESFAALPNKPFIHPLDAKKNSINQNSRPISSLSNYALVSQLKEEYQKNPPTEDTEIEDTHPLEKIDLQKELLKNLSTEIDSLDRKKEQVQNSKKPEIAKPAITNTFLTKTNEPKPWYTRDEANSYEKRRSGGRFKDFNDPLKEIRKHTTSHSHSSKPAIKPTVDKDNSQDLDRLRAERLRRESAERDRERKLLADIGSQSRPPPRYHLPTSRPSHVESSSDDDVPSKSSRKSDKKKRRKDSKRKSKKKRRHTSP